MTNDPFVVKMRLDVAKRRLEELWEQKGYTDWEVMDAAFKVDRLLNHYNRLIWKNEKCASA